MSQILGTILVGLLSLSAVGQTSNPVLASQGDAEHTVWIADTLRSIHTVKVGQTRADLLKAFTTEGGISTTSQRQYVYRQCPFIKVLVKFAAADREKELPTDKIIEISRPYLEWSVMD